MTNSQKKEVVFSLEFADKLHDLGYSVIYKNGTIVIEKEV